MGMRDIRYESLGKILVDLCPEDAQRIVLYSEFEPGVVSMTTSCVLDGQIFWFEGTDGLTEELLRLQEQFDDDVRAMTVDLWPHTGQLAARFTYDDKFDEESAVHERSDAVMKEYLGTAEAKRPFWQKTSL